MRQNFHESYGAGAIKPPSERSTGFVFAVVATIVALWWRNTPNVMWTAIVLAVALAVLSLVAPWVLRPLNILWFRIGLLLHRIVNPLVMLAMFAFVFVPAGLLMRLWHDPLRTHRAGSGGTYWVERRPETQQIGSMTNQF